MGTRSAATEIQTATAFVCAVFSAADSCALITAGLSPVAGEPEGTPSVEVDVAVDPGGVDSVAEPAGGGGVAPGNVAVAAGDVAVAAGGVTPDAAAPGDAGFVAEGLVADEADAVGCGGGRGIPLGCGPGDTAGMANPINEANAIKCCRCSSRSGPSSSPRAGADASARS